MNTKEKEDQKWIGLSTKETEDQWKHRSTRMRCGSCMHFVSKVTEVPFSEELPMLGRCRKHAPTLNGWLAVFEQDWCGDHKLDENKL